MCRVKEQLKSYESVIVDNISNLKMSDLENDVRKDVYSYKIPYQEAVLKSEWKFFNHFVPIYFNGLIKNLCFFWNFEQLFLVT